MLALRVRGGWQVRLSASAFSSEVLLLNEAAQSKLGCLKGSVDEARKRL